MKCFTSEIIQPDTLVYTPNIEQVEPFTYDSYETCNVIPVKEVSVKNSASEYDDKLKTLNIILDKLDANTVKSACFGVHFHSQIHHFSSPRAYMILLYQHMVVFVPPSVLWLFC